MVVEASSLSLWAPPDNYRDADYFDLRSEMDIMRRMEPHPNIINLLGVCSETGNDTLSILLAGGSFSPLRNSCPPPH